MTTQSVTKRIERLILPGLKHIPLLHFYAQTRGWPYILSWCHRVSGVLLVLYLWIHIYTLTLLQTPELFNSKMKLFRFFLFVLLEWLLTIPVIYHALNGGRLILYETFGTRKDASIIRWTLSLSSAYIITVGLMMVLGNQTVSPIFYWLGLLIISTGLSYIVAARIWQTQNSAAWKLQRISGSFLVLMIPAHLLFMHLQPSVGHDAVLIIDRMQNLFIKLIDCVLVIAALYHGGYGLLSIAKDYMPSRGVQKACTFFIFIVMVSFAGIAIKLLMAV